MWACLLAMALRVWQRRTARQIQARVARGGRPAHSPHWAFVLCRPLSHAITATATVTATATAPPRPPRRPASAPQRVVAVAAARGACGAYDTDDLDGGYGAGALAGGSVAH